MFKRINRMIQIAANMAGFLLLAGLASFFGFRSVEAFAAQSYGMAIDGVVVTSDNKGDILGNGVFVFDGDHTLTIKGDYSGKGTTDLVKSNVANLVIRIEADSVLDAHGKNCFAFTEDTTIVGKDWQNLLLLHSSQAAGIYIAGGHTLTLNHLMMNISGKWGITGTQSGEKLVVNTSYIETTCRTGAVCDMTGGIRLSGCDLMNRCKIENGSIVTGSGSYETDVVISISYSGTWVQDEKGWWYQNPDGSYPKNQFKKIDGKWYYFGAGGYRQTGWKIIDETWYCFDENGEMQTGWKQIDEKWYYFAVSGEMQTGWKKLSEKWYYFGENGVMRTGWKEIEGKWYYFNENGMMQTGWLELNSRWYFLKDSGELYHGWKKMEDTWCYLNESGYRQTGWKEIDGHWYFFRSTGALFTGWRYSDGNWYYFGESGRMQTGWKQLDEKWYYFNEAGIMQAGFTSVGNHTYYFNDSGVMQTGWKKLDGKWYYFGENGVMKTGWYKEEPYYYYLKEDGSMAKDEWVDNGRYYIDSQGHWIKNPAA